MVSLDGLNQKYKEIEDLEQNAYALALKKITGVVTEARKWTSLTEVQKLEAAEKFTKAIDQAAYKMAGVRVDPNNEFAVPLIGSPGGFTYKHAELIAKNVTQASAVYNQGMSSITNKLSDVIPKSIKGPDDIRSLATELHDRLGIDAGKVNTLENVVKLWQFNYNKMKGIEAENELLVPYMPDVTTQ